MKVLTPMSKRNLEMKKAKIVDHMPESPNMVAGDGDGIKQSMVRYQLPSSKKFMSPNKKNDDMKLRIELALHEIKGGHKMKKPQVRKNAEIVTVCTPTRVFKKKCKPSEDDRVAIIYGTPRSSSEQTLKKKDAARLIFKCLLLQSWRKSRMLYKELTESLKNREEKVTQLDIQIDVLKNLRRSESARREEVQKKCQETQKEIDQLIQDNIALKNENECMRTDCFTKIKEFNEINQQLINYKNVCEERQHSVRVLKEKLDKEKEKARRSFGERKHSAEQNVKLENILNIQKEKVEELTSQIRMLKNSVIVLENALAKSEKVCENYTKELHEQTLLTESYKSQIIEFQKERIAMNQELKNLQSYLDIAHSEYSHLQCRNDAIEKDILDISNKLDLEKEHSPWNMMRKGMYNTYHALRCMANLLLPALQSNLRY